jgi:hypothetical protein
MKFEKIKDKSDALFRRLCGVKKTTFKKMIEILTESYKIKHKKGGRPRKLPIEEQLLMTLEYLREYRTYAHIGLSYGLSESATFQIITWVENVLVASKEFALPGKKALLSDENEIEIVLIDASESPIERPKKNKENSIPARKKGIR